MYKVLCEVSLSEPGFKG